MRVVRYPSLAAAGASVACASASALLAVAAVGHAQTPAPTDPISTAQPAASAAAGPADATAPAPTGTPAAPGTSAAPAAPAGPAALSEICTDRPTKSSSTCTVDAGHFQYEADIFNGTFMHLDGVTTDTYLVFNPTLKYGLTSNLDIEASISPFDLVRTREANGQSQTIGGVSDLFLKVKYEFLNVYGGNLTASLIPYVKVPTARVGIGNGVVEQGALLPVTYKLNSVVSVTTVPEMDDLKDDVGAGHHINTQQLVNFSFSLPQNVTLYGELWGEWNFDPTGTVHEYSADVAASYVIGQYLQLDGGLNFGLNRYTPGVQAYVGVSQKF